MQVPLQKCRFWRPYNRDLTFLVPRIPWEFWYYMGFDGVFSRLYILLCILSSNAFGHFGIPVGCYSWLWLKYIEISFLIVMCYRFYSVFRDVLGCSVVFLDVFLFIYVFFCNPGTNLVITVMFTLPFIPWGPNVLWRPKKQLTFFEKWRLPEK